MHSIYGRALGVTLDGYITGQQGYQDVINAATSASTATALKPYGINTLSVTTGSSSAGAGFTMSAPYPGVSVIVTNVTTSSTQAITVTLASGTFMTGAFAAANVTAGSSYNKLTLNNAGETVSLVGISTSYYLVRSLNGFSTGDTPLSTG